MDPRHPSLDHGDPDLSWNPRLAQDADALAFVCDLSNYIALGCLSIEDASPSDGCNLWRDITKHLMLVLEHHLGMSISKLSAEGWIRIQYLRTTLETQPQHLIFRVYILPADVGLRYIDRRNAKLSTAMEHLVSMVDTSPDTWRGRSGPERNFDLYAAADDCSLFYMFNQIPSPAPDPHAIREKYTREALEDLLDPDLALPGLKTPLYPYQRRSAAIMLQRETVARLELDPRLEERFAPDGTKFFYAPRDAQFLRDPRFYEAPRGGILAETMGLGKTVICLSLILATKHHPAKVPLDLNTPSTRSKVASLMDLATAAVNKYSVPWKVEIERLRQTGRGISSACIQKLEQSPAQYEIPHLPNRWNRATVVSPPQRIILASTTIIVVPRNLCKQWESEMAKHVEEGALQVLVMDDARPLPSSDTLRTYDVILFSRPRFDMESKHGLDEQGRSLNFRLCQCPYIGASRKKDCNCVSEDSLYDSPLKHLHFKRLIIDEGHFFGQSNTNTVAVANRLVKSDHRWVVSGTPARDLLGVEMDMKASGSMQSNESRESVLEQRRQFSDEDRKRNGAIDSLGLLASNFLKIQPWSDITGEKAAVWKDHIYRGPRRMPLAFSTCLRRTLEGMVVKTRPEDVERDIELPPLHHRIVRLTPSFYDKLTANMFTLVLTANAVTSERTDTDYLFHKNSQKARYQLVSNLRQSAFFWTGFSEADVDASIKNSTGYLSKADTACTDADRELLQDALSCTETVLASKGWQAMSRSHELGFFVEKWPVESAEHWTFDATQPLLTGISQLLDAQQFVNTRLHTPDPGAGLSGAGIRALAPARATKDQDGVKPGKPIMSKLGVPVSSLDGEPRLRGKAKLSPSKSPSQTRYGKSHSSKQNSPSERKYAVPTGLSQGPVASEKPHETVLDQASQSPLAKTRVVGTTSAKMSYLISQVLRYYQTEKILIFYQGDNIAYYIAQALELLHIKHEIYAKSLSAVKQSEYVVRFNQEPHDRVLLMDVKQAALGLNLCSASRIFFINPVCRPNIEAQAIKRAHRIGQTREVFVETLVLKETIEEQILERSLRMTRSEHIDAKALEDDGGIQEIIQSARRIDLTESEQTTLGQMAPLEEPQQLWGRLGWTQFSIGGQRQRPQQPHQHGKRKRSVSPDTNSSSPVKDRAHPQAIVHRSTGSLQDVTNHRVDSIIEANNDDEPLADQWIQTGSDVSGNSSLFGKGPMQALSAATSAR